MDRAAFLNKFNLTRLHARNKVVVGALYIFYTRRKEKKDNKSQLYKLVQIQMLASKSIQGSKQGNENTVHTMLSAL